MASPKESSPPAAAALLEKLIPRRLKLGLNLWLMKMKMKTCLM